MGVINDVCDPAMALGMTGRQFGGEFAAIAVATIRQAIDDAECIAERKRMCGEVYDNKIEAAALSVRLDEQATLLDEFLDGEHPFSLRWCCMVIEAFTSYVVPADGVARCVRDVLGGAKKPAGRWNIMPVGTRGEILAFEDYRERERARNRRRRGKPL